jgi:hypothetical protein
MLLMLQALVVEILRGAAAVGAFCTWICIAAFLKMSVKRGMKWIGNQIRKRRNADSLHKQRRG